MKIPESVRINGIEYAVKYVENLNDGNVVLMGEIDYAAREIHLNSSLGMDPQQTAIVLLHEICHGIREASGRDPFPEAEIIVEMYARGFYQLMQDNGRRLYDLKDPEK